MSGLSGATGAVLGLPPVDYIIFILHRNLAPCNDTAVEANRSTLTVYSVSIAVCQLNSVSQQGLIEID
jgi:hypothetical protein